VAEYPEVGTREVKRAFLAALLSSMRRQAGMDRAAFIRFLRG